MSKTLRFAKTCALFVLTAVAASEANAQVIVFVQAPPGLTGSYEMTWADPGGGWGTPDLNDPANAVTNTLAFVDDGTAGDSLGCNPLVNGPDVAGKIAVVYRGTCEFGAKALNAENEGAVAVVIINNNGAPVAMGAGAQGANVTIPVVMISQGAGALLKSEIEAGNVVMFIGNVAGQFNNNVGMYRGDMLLPKHSATPSLICGDATEYAVSPGSWVQNNGLLDQVGVTLNAEVVLGATSLYDQTSTPVDVFAGDSVFITLPDFTQPTYGGMYDLTYTTASDSVEPFMGDNTWSTDFLIDSIFSYGAIDPVTELPIANGTHYRPGGTGVTVFGTCIHFMDANASRLGAVGMYVSTAAGATDSVTAELVEITAYQWDDVFTGLSDPNIAFDNLITIAEGDYTYASNIEFANIYVPFDDAFALEDNQRYLFCLYTYGETMYHGFGEGLDYVENWNLNDQPTCVLDSAGAAWFSQGFGSEIVSSIGVRMISADDVGLQETNASSADPAFPNPASTFVTIPLKGWNGQGRLEIFNTAGTLVSTQAASINGERLVADITGLSNGAYTFMLTLDGGQPRSFQVVVNR